MKEEESYTFLIKIVRATKVDILTEALERIRYLEGMGPVEELESMIDEIRNDKNNR
jgi:hypothetical protein